MLMGSLIAWWYGAGLKRRADDLWNGLLRTIDLFSIGVLIRTLFSPFKLISAGSAPNAPIGVQFRMWADRLFSRCFGAVIRTVVILIGLVIIVLQLVMVFVLLCVHLVVPMLPILGLVMFAMGIELPWTI